MDDKRNGRSASERRALVAAGLQHKEERAYARLGDAYTFSSSPFSSPLAPGALTSERVRTKTELSSLRPAAVRASITEAHTASQNRQLLIFSQD